jgi:hypothetical protein
VVSDQDRRDLYDALEQRLGQGPATTMMELLPPVGWSDLARQSDLVAVRGEIAQVRGEMAEVRGEIAEVRGELGKVHGEIAKLSARIDGQIPRFIWANVPVVASVAGLVLAASKLT